MRKFSLFTAMVLLVCSSFGQVVINEITTDPANNDGSPANQTAEFIELYNAGGSSVDISGWILMDNDAVIRIPSGTTIAAGAFYLMSSYGANSAAGGNFTSGISCQTCDFFGISLNGNWGPNSPNLQRVGAQIIGSTCANGINMTPTTSPDCSGDGNKPEAWLLIDNNKNVVDAVYWGTKNPCAVTGQTYALPAFGSLPAVSIDITNAPFDGTSNTNVPTAANLTNTNDIKWQYAGAQLNGCNSSYIRQPDGGSWASTTWNNTSLSTLGTFTTGAQPTTMSTNHPTPGKSNASVPFTFSVSGVGLVLKTAASDPTQVQEYTMCTAAPVTFTYIVNNYQNVQQVLTYASGKIGSFISATGTGAFSPVVWPTITQNSPAAGQTTLTYTVTPPTGSTTYQAVWEDYVLNCCGGSSYNTPTTLSSCAWECYESRKVKITVAATFAVSKTTLSCPADAIAGSIDLSAYVSGGNAPYTYAIGSGIGASLSGSVITMPAAATGPFVVNINEAATACGTEKTITINANCAAAAPACPGFTAYAACASLPANICPGTDLSFSLTGSNLPNGAIIEWVNDINNNGPYDETSANVVASQTFTNSTITPATVTSCSDLLPGDIAFTAYNGNTTTESFTIIPLKNLAAGMVIHFTDNAWTTATGPLSTNEGLITWTVPAGGIAAGTSITFTAGAPWTATSGTVTNNGTGTGSAGIALVNSGDNIFAVCGTLSGSGASTTIASPTFISMVTSSTIVTSGGVTSGTTYLPGNLSQGSSAIVKTAGTGNSAYSCISGSIPFNNAKDSLFLSSKWFTTGANSTVANPPACSINFGTLALSPTCAIYRVPASACNTTLNILPRLTPQVTCTGTTNPTLSARAFTVTCPTATLSGGGQLCNGSPAGSVNLTITSSSSLVGYTLTYLQNGSSVTSAAFAGSSPYNIAVTTPGTYEVVSLNAPGGSCAGSITGGPVEVTTQNPPISFVQGGCTGVLADQPTITVFPSDVVSASTTYKVLSASPVPFASAYSNSTGEFTLPATTTSATVQMNNNGCITTATLSIGTCNALPVLLPVHLISLNATLHNNQVLINWVSNTETNLKNYVVEKSKDGNLFTEIGALDAKNAVSANYNFTDARDIVGSNYYRLKITDKDGKIQYSYIVKAYMNKDDIAIGEIYPNPTNNFINVKVYSKKSQPLNYYIASIDGKTVLSNKVNVLAGENVFKVDLRLFNSGTYFLVINNANEKMIFPVIKR